MSRLFGRAKNEYDLLSGLNERSLANLIVQPIEESYNATGLLFEHTWFYALQLVYITISLSVKNINSFEPNFEHSICKHRVIDL